jgi:Ribbon-helix-helix protein, copG family
MAKKSEVQKLAGWWKGNKELVDPPEREQRGDTLKYAEIREERDEPEEQYNIRVPRSLKKRLKRLVIEEEKPMGVILEKMLELYLQHRARRAERSDESHR